MSHAGRLDGRELPFSAELVHTLLRHAQDRSGLDLADQIIRHIERQRDCGHGSMNFNGRGRLEQSEWKLRLRARPFRVRVLKAETFSLGG